MPAQEKPKVIAIVGPTASGKTALSLDLAEQLNGEIIACDSRTVYKHFDIGTAKPSAEELARVRHHCIDVVEPDEDFTVAQFRQLGSAAISNMISRGKIPLVCGGTGFYARALLEGLVMPSVPPQPQLRDQWRRFADEHGNEVLHAELQKIDGVTAERLNVNDRFRIIRALEVYQVTGRPMSEVATREELPYKTIWVGLTAEDRSFLHANIKKRFYEQMDAGMMAETERLYQMYGPHQKLMHTVNYRQLVQLIEGKLDQQTAFDDAIKHNNQLARRQLIWFRANPSIRWFAIDRLSKTELTHSVSSYINEAIAAIDVERS